MPRVSNYSGNSLFCCKILMFLTIDFSIRYFANALFSRVNGCTYWIEMPHYPIFLYKVENIIAMNGYYLNGLLKPVSPLTRYWISASAPSSVLWRRQRWRSGYSLQNSSPSDAGISLAQIAVTNPNSTITVTPPICK